MHSINFLNTSALRLIFFFKMFKIWWRSHKCTKNWEKIFSFVDNSISIGCFKHSLLTNSLKILDTAQNESFKLKFFQKDPKKWENYCGADLSTILDPLTCRLSISVLTRSFLFISETTLFAVYNFVYTSAMRLIFFFKIFKIWCRFQKCKKMLRKYFQFWR